jgi:hypothetical protein
MIGRRTGIGQARQGSQLAASLEFERSLHEAARDYCLNWYDALETLVRSLLGLVILEGKIVDKGGSKQSAAIGFRSNIEARWSLLASIHVSIGGTKDDGWFEPSFYELGTGWAAWELACDMSLFAVAFRLSPLAKICVSSPQKLTLLNQLPSQNARKRLTTPSIFSS